MKILSEVVQKLNYERLGAYERYKDDILEHYGIEQRVLAGGYAYRQILELVQNGADAILDAHEDNTLLGDGRIQVVLDSKHLYVANTGAPLTDEGLKALLRSHSSPKRGNQIGRFGLGFKSLLKLGGKIDFFTRSRGAIRFEPERCRDELHSRFGVSHCPGLRLAWPLEDAERAKDSTLAQFDWAETIVRVNVPAPDLRDRLRTEISEFPTEFLLFFPVSLQLSLDAGTGSVKELRVFAPSENERVLSVDGNNSRWHLASRQVQTTEPRARDDATHIHSRDSVPLAWAMPIDAAREEAGRFWAFFPTHTLTYLPGILNAPWKVNDDRNAIVGGAWNTLLMQEAAKLIVATLPSLYLESDPGCVIDAFPRRMERKDEEAAPLVEAVWKEFETAAVVPDAAGNLRPASELWRAPKEDVGLTTMWQGLASARALECHVHPSCSQRQRSGRLQVLSERLRANSSSDDEHFPNLLRQEPWRWFSFLTSHELSHCLRVLKLAEAFQNECGPTEWEQVLPNLAIVPIEDGAWITSPKAVFAPPGVILPHGLYPVSQAVASEQDARRILSGVMKVRPLDGAAWHDILSTLRRDIPDWNADLETDRWRVFWKNLRACPFEIGSSFVAGNRTAIRVLRRDETWQPGNEVLKPGMLVDPDVDTSNSGVLVDEIEHERDEKWLEMLGVVELPEGTIELEDHDSLRPWMSYWREFYRTNVSESARWGYLQPFRLRLPRGWALLISLEGEPNAKFSAHLLKRFNQGEFAKKISFGHATVSTYDRIEVPHPLIWILHRYGTVQLGSRTVRLHALVERRHEPVVAMLQQWQDVESALEYLLSAVPEVEICSEEICCLWLGMIEELTTKASLEQDSLGELWRGAARDGVVPDRLWVDEQEVLLEEICVTGSPDLASRARSDGYIVVTLDNATMRLWLDEGARDLAEMMRPEWHHETGPASPLVAAMPELGEVLREDAKHHALCLPVAGLKMRISAESHVTPCLLWESMLILDHQQLSELSRSARLEHVLREVAAAGWLQSDSAEALRLLGDGKVDELRAGVASGSTLEERLFLAVGKRDEPLRQALGELSHVDWIQQCRGLSLAALVLAQLGPATLGALKKTFAEEGLNPPGRWTPAQARAFALSIGFPEEFGTSPDVRRDPEEFVNGPIHLPPLHDFQEDVFHGIRELIKLGNKRRRAVVSLPTGGGKTRVTVQAAVVLVLKPKSLRRTVLWIAQTDELCEQAVQAFRQVWVNLGEDNTELRIVRLWGGNPDPAIDDSGNPVVIVASIQTLNNRIRSSALAWLQCPGLVVVDECHHAIAPSYTNLLRWLDAEAPRAGAPQKDEPPILGLSATPFRMDDEESRRLAQRFDNRWQPVKQENLHARLRGQGVLSEIVSEALESGTGLLPDEIERLAQIPQPWEGIVFENLLEAINQRLAGNSDRNERLVERIRAANERCILLFANSVSHAEEMSARLNLQGIPSAAVSGGTQTIARRYFLKRFQQGKIRVLCNHSVLSTGFDAPKTDMVLISRAVFSPVRYMQIVGRGLRGEKNGGTKLCRIVTVLDNLGRFQDRHPYHFCARYFED
ncbi:superfamily II DNA or RNA helicase [Roseimicrobium gellanilyticum]|uniref:Superfamily II DNA or RNA helicase n=1 Tax=Roseimicrobium gellanilyticum TaxID=748857 RepID=A0A366HNW7_9BACT|nr:DEAD/DEAH box helicase [Roseimicrobium gellanilyticum]RBP45210.1 superfamily II DNA or RNA helicase [Roseimicrobium gellanilyticum]